MGYGRISPRFGQLSNSASLKFCNSKVKQVIWDTFFMAPRKMNLRICLCSVLVLMVVTSMLSMLRPTDEYQQLLHLGETQERVFMFNVGNYIGPRGEEVKFPLRCTSCALVGTAGTLLSSGRGQAIDSNSCVFRLSFSPVRGFEKDLGTRTTARIVDSFRFHPFLKKPEKLVTGPYTSENWFLFDRRPGDITRFHNRLERLFQKHPSVAFFWFNRRSEQEAFESLRQEGRHLNYTMMGARPSALWFGVRVMEGAGCRDIRVFGVPHPRLCKQELDVEFRSLYWRPRSAPLCSSGMDAGAVVPGNASSVVGEVVSLAERRALLSWSLRRGNVQFESPTWPFPPP